MVNSLFEQIRVSNCTLDAGEFLVKLNQLQSVPAEVTVVQQLNNIPPISDFPPISTLEENVIVDSSLEIIR